MSIDVRLLHITPLVIVLLIISGNTYSDNICTTKYTKFNLCAEAREVSDEIAKTLPMQLSKNMSWESASSFDTTIQAIFRLHYDRAFLEDTYKKAGLPVSFAKESMIKASKGMCTVEVMNAFISLGGKVRYIYSFIDGERFIQIDVTQCD